MNALNVNITYSYVKEGILDENYEYREPCMEIFINSNNGCNKGWLGDKLNGRTLHITKKSSENLHVRSKCTSEICSTVGIGILSPSEECRAFDNELTQLTRKGSCDSCSCQRGNLNLFRSTPKGIHSALEAILKVSNTFSETKDQWLGEAIKFIDNGPLASKHTLQLKLNPALERNIRQALGNQEGAMNLLQDLKRETYSQAIQIILERLLNGVYGDFSSEFEPTTKLTEDLERRNLNHLVQNIYQGRYDHEGPNAEKNIAKLVATCTELLKKDQSHL